MNFIQGDAPDTIVVLTVSRAAITKYYQYNCDTSHLSVRFLVGERIQLLAFQSLCCHIMIERGFVYWQVRVAEYSNVKTQLSTNLRKQSGRYFMLHPNMLEMVCNCDHIIFSLLLM